MITAFPLAWPTGWPRTARNDRRDSRFGHKTTGTYESGGSWSRMNRGVSVADGTARVLAELQRFGVVRDDIVISTNLELRRDGLPYSNRRPPEDPGVCVYWSLDGEKQCMAIDVYDSVGENLAAVAKTIEAMRAIDRHGGATIMKRAFLGFKALPAGSSGGIVLPLQLPVDEAARVVAQHSGRPASLIEREPPIAKLAVREARAKVHPDRTGKREDFDRVQDAAATLSRHHGVQL